MKTAYRRKSLLWLMVALTLLAAGLRVFRLEEVPLRGDEAFTVRFWAASPSETWAELADHEPHPIGVFVLFWAWKSLAGESEFAMRALPLLLNLLGVPLMMVLGRRLIGAGGTVWMLGLLWAINPFQVWHAQDVRNYAIWAACSLLAMGLFLLAVERDRPRDWALFGATSAAACYVFFLELFLLVVQGLYLAMFYRRSRRIMKHAAITLAVMILILLPWIVQLIRLAGSDYEGTAHKVSLEALVKEFVPTLLFGEGRLSLAVGVGLLLVMGVGLVRGSRRTLPERALLGLWIFLPLGLLMAAGTQMSVFRPRYVIAITPALLLTLLWIAQRARLPALPLAVTAILVGVSGVSLEAYFFRDPPKAPDWRSFAEFLEARAGEDDVIVVSNVDPAFRYYYRGAASDVPYSEVADPAELLHAYRAVFVQQGDSTFPISRFLQDEAQFIPPALPLVKQYRGYEPNAAEIQQPLNLRLGNVARLRGYSVAGADRFGVTVFLYWEPLRQTENDMVGFVHVTQPPDPFLVAQDDHAPLNNLAPTMAWQVGDLLRDAFYVRLPAGSYALEVGMYETGSGDLLAIYDSAGRALGHQYRLAEVTIKE